MITHILSAVLTVLAADALETPTDTIVSMHEVTVSGQRERDFQMRSSQTSMHVGRDFIQHNFAGSLIQTLQQLPGIKAMSIGSGQSKPVIRGLGFNRMAVIEDGVKHEGQQWGDDHGLEIDQFAIDRAEVIKGPAALLYGSDAIGGVLNLYTNHIPTETFAGSVQLFGRTNNEQVGIAARVGGRHGKWFYRANATLIDYADYRVPTDSIQYYSYWIRLKDRRLRNTAGCERDGSVMIGYAGYNFHTDLRISDSYAKSGFFANAHGLEVRLSDIDYDRRRRDIDLPYQWVNHLKLLSHTTWRDDNATAIELNLAFQDNRREEHSEPVSHGYMPTPEGTLERSFSKYTISGALSLRRDIGSHELRGGISGEYQHNRRGGWGFILPDFELTTAGGFLTDRWTLTPDLIVNAGVRYDFARSHIHAYQDWYATPPTGYTQRSAEMSRNFHSVTWSAGVNYAVNSLTLKANVGKSFRVPIAKELGADGINYHIFRYERGNSRLDPEEAYQIDASVSYDAGGLHLQADPYVNYFPNNIYLSPSAHYVEGLQLYAYSQARVLRWGFEAQATYRFSRHWQGELQGEYLWARQMSGSKKGYTLPFSPPWNINAAVKYTFGTDDDGYVRLDADIVGRQHDIVPPEKPTDGHWTLNVAAGKDFNIGATVLSIALHADNILNRRYYDHTSYYRLIDVPEPGFNLSAMIGLHF